MVQPHLPRTGKIPRIPPAVAGGWFSPALCFPLLGAQVGIERSTGCRRWDSRVFLVSCRRGLNDPPAAGGCTQVAKCWKQRIWHLAQFDPLVESKRLPATCVQPPAAGGIQEASTYVETLAGPLCATLVELFVTSEPFLF